MERRLSAILAADVVGYTRLMGQDEAGTLRVLTEFRQQVIEPLVAEHGGRIFKLMGDGLLVEFPSVTNSVACAMAWQAAGSQLEFRIGINLGEVLVDGDDLYGDGVNLASRLQAIAEPGAIALSADAQRYASGRIDVEFDDLGEKALKNVADPVQVFQIRRDQKVAGAKSISTTSRSEKPSLAVLPLTNMSGDPEQEFFSDGITEDIITELSRFRLLHVIARNSSFAFKGKHVDIREVGRALDAQFVLEGSVRRAGNRVRITAQLIEAETGKHVWAERYDREMDDIFAVQDEVTRSIVAVMPGRVQEAVAKRASRGRPENMKAYEVMLRGRAVRDSFSAEATQSARELFQQAIALDPHYARAYSNLADTYFVDFMLGLSNEASSGKMAGLMRKAAELDGGDVHIQEEMGFAYIADGAWDAAAAQFERAIPRVLNHAEVGLWCGYGLMMLGRHEEALDLIQRAIDMDPMCPPSFGWAHGQVLYMAGHFDEATRVLQAGTLLNSLGHACRVGAYARLGAPEAETALNEFKIERRHEFASRGIELPTETVESRAGGFRGMWRRERDWAHIAEGLRLAGLAKGISETSPRQT